MNPVCSPASVCMDHIAPSMSCWHKTGNVMERLKEAKTHYEDEKNKVRAEVERKHRVHLGVRCNADCFTGSTGGVVCKTMLRISLGRDRLLGALDRLYDAKLRDCLDLIHGLMERMEECTVSNLTAMAYDAQPITFPGKSDLERMREPAEAAVVHTYREMNIVPYLRELSAMSNHRVFSFDPDAVPIRPRYELWWLMMHWFRMESESVRTKVAERLSSLFADCVMQSRRRTEGPERYVCGGNQVIALRNLERCQRMWIEAFWAWAVDEDFERIKGKRKQMELDEDTWRRTRKASLASIDSLRELMDPLRGAEVGSVRRDRMLEMCVAGVGRDRMLKLFPENELVRWARERVAAVLRMCSYRQRLFRMRADWVEQLHSVPMLNQKTMWQVRRKTDASLERAAMPVFREWESHVEKTEAEAMQRMRKAFTHQYYYPFALEQTECESQMHPVQVVLDVMHVAAPRPLTGVMGFGAINMKSAGYWVSSTEQAKRRYRLLLMKEFLDEDGRLMSGAGMHELWLPMQSALARRGPYFVHNMLRAVEDSYILQGVDTSKHREHVRRCADEWKAALWYLGHGVWSKRG